MRIRVLLVDDNTMFRSALRAMLEGRPVLDVVAEAEDGATALEQIGRLMPDVVVIDRFLPGNDGIEVTRLIKDRHPETAVIILSGIDDPESRSQAASAGATTLLNKGSSLHKLVPTIVAAAEQRSSGSRAGAFGRPTVGQ